MPSGKTECQTSGFLGWHGNPKGVSLGDRKNFSELTNRMPSESLSRLAHARSCMRYCEGESCQEQKAIRQKKPIAPFAMGFYNIKY